MATINDIKNRLKREGYEERVVIDGGPSLIVQLKGLIRTSRVGA
jgi:hypothetical protein